MMAYRLERRLDSDGRFEAMTRVAGVIGAMIVAGIVLMFTGRNPFSLLIDVFDAIFGNGKRGLEGVGLQAIPILMCALGVALSLRMKIWNIGSDGQFLMGAFAAVGVGIHWDGPDIAVLPTMAVAAILAGAAWMLIPALARAYWNVNEIITTLLLNFVALELVAWAALGFWRDEEAAVVQSTPPVESVLPALPGLDRLSTAFLVPLVIAAALWWIFRSTTVGYEVDTIGGNRRAAAFAGIRVNRRMLTVMLITGAIAGLGGMLQLSAPGAQRLSTGFSAQYGLSGFIVATLAAGSFVGLVVGGLFVAAMFYSGQVLTTKGLSTYIIFAVYGVILLGIALGEVSARYRIVKAEPTGEGVPA